MMATDACDHPRSRGSCYLMMMAVAYGRIYDPHASHGRGLVLPFIALAFLSISCLSLIQIGGIMQNPTGADDEDLAVLHLLDATCKYSRVSRTPRSNAARTRACVRACAVRACARALAAPPVGRGPPVRASVIVS